MEGCRRILRRILRRRKPTKIIAKMPDIAGIDAYCPKWFFHRRRGHTATRFGHIRDAFDHILGRVS